MDKTVAPMTKRVVLLTVAMAVMLVVALTGCRMQADLSFDDNGNGMMVMSVTVTEEELNTPDMQQIQDRFGGIDCSLFTKIMNEDDADDGISYEFTDKSTDGDLVCENKPMTLSPAADGYSFTKDNGRYTLSMSGTEGIGADLENLQDEDLDIDVNIIMTFTMPGTVIKSTVGKVDGNTVTVTDIAQLEKDIVIVADANDTASPSVETDVPVTLKIDVDRDGTMSGVLIVDMSPQQMEKATITRCADLDKTLGKDIFPNVKTTVDTDDSNGLTCTMRADHIDKGSLHDFKAKGKNNVFTYKANQAIATRFGGDDVQFRATMTMPNTVVDASAGQVHGKTVVITDAKEFTNNITVDVKKSQMLMLLLIIIAVVLALVIIVAIIAVIASKKKEADTPRQQWNSQPPQGQQQWQQNQQQWQPPEPGQQPSQQWRQSQQQWQPPQQAQQPSQDSQSPQSWQPPYDAQQPPQ